MPDSYGTDDYLTFADDLNFRMAVGVRLEGEKQLKYNPKVIRWIAKMTSKDDTGTTTETYLPLHDCTEEDFEDFHPL